MVRWCGIDRSFDVDVGDVETGCSTGTNEKQIQIRERWKV